MCFWLSAAASATNMQEDPPVKVYLSSVSKSSKVNVVISPVRCKIFIIFVISTCFNCIDAVDAEFCKQSSGTSLQKLCCMLLRMAVEEQFLHKSHKGSDPRHPP